MILLPQNSCNFIASHYSNRHLNFTLFHVFNWPDLFLLFYNNINYQVGKVVIISSGGSLNKFLLRTIVG